MSTLGAEGRLQGVLPARSDREDSGARSPARAWLRLPLVVLIVVLAVTAVLAGVSHALFTRNETRQLKLRVEEAGSVVTATLPQLQTTLGSAAELAEATNGDVAKFRRFVTPYVGAGTSFSFVSVSLWRLSALDHGPAAVVGVPPKLAARAPDAPRLFARPGRMPRLSVVGLLAPPDRRLGYAFVTPGPTGRFAVYGERGIPPNRLSRIHGNSAFADLNYALYLGSSVRPESLLLTSVSQLPLRGRKASVTVPFGDSALTLVMTPRGTLSGNLPRLLPWIIGIVGIMLAICASVVTLHLIRGRRDAEQLADTLETTASENRRLYAEQRTIAQELQHALLPDALPNVRGVESSAVYQAGEHGVEIGGDWYDLIALPDRRLLLVVGDVSGKGVRAATTMAALRYAIHAYAAQDDPPAEILNKLSGLLSIARSGQFATVLCLLVDIDRHEVTFSSAGHLPPLVIADGQGEYLRTEIGVPIGVEADAPYASTTVTVPPAAKLLAFTDGLVERRREDLAQSLARLRDAAGSHDDGLPQLLRRLVAGLHEEPSDDDTALVGLRWTS